MHELHLVPRGDTVVSFRDGIPLRSPKDRPRSVADASLAVCLLQQALGHGYCPGRSHRVDDVDRHRDIARTYDRYVAGGGAAAVDLALGRS